MFMLLFGSYDAIHPTREWRSLDSADVVEEPKALAGPESAAGSLDVAELDYSTRHRTRGDGGDVSHARSGNDPSILASRFPESVRHLALARGVR